MKQKSEPEGVGVQSLTSESEPEATRKAEMTEKDSERRRKGRLRVSILDFREKVKRRNERQRE